MILETSSGMLALAVFLAATLTPLNDLRSRPYDFGLSGGLWENGSNEIPAEHLAEGLRRAGKIQPLDANGVPSPAGKIVFLGAGFSETSRIFCAPNPFDACEARSFVSLALNHPRVNKDNLVLLNAAHPALDAEQWFPFDNSNYERIENTVLAPAGVTEQQVQGAWIQMIDAFTDRPSLPPPHSDAYMIKRYIAAVVRAMKSRYPNLQIVYISSRVYGGYSSGGFHPEPHAYESGLSVRWIVVGQVETMRVAHIGPHWDSTMGDLNYAKDVVPWLTWGPYLWANGAEPRSDGLTWEREDFEFDGAMLSERGAAKGARLLLDFLLQEPTAAGWFAKPASVTTPVRTRSVRH